MRILLTGAEGLVGRAVLARAGRRGVDVVGLSRAACDVTDATARDAALARWRPDAVLFCAAATDVDRCATDRRSRAVNVEAPAAWADRAPTLYLSSNFVFGGWGPHGPGGAPSPQGVYAAQKAEAEARVLAAGGAVARVGWVVGPGGRTFGSRLAARLRAGETVRAIHDLVVMPTWSEDLADALLDLPWGLTHHLGAGETSWYAFALAVQARVGTGHVAPVRLAELGLPEPRPRDGRMSPATLRPWWAWIDELVART